MRTCDLAPNYSNLGPPHFSLRPVDKCDFLAEIKTGNGGTCESAGDFWGVVGSSRSGFWVVDAFDLDQTLNDISIACRLIPSLLLLTSSLDSCFVSLFDSSDGAP